MVYIPSDALVLNVKTQFGAVGDGIADDTVAIQTAITTAIKTNRRYTPQFIYFPAGTYKITNTLRSFDAAATTVWNGYRSGMILFGEDKDTTIIKLADNAAGYNSPSTPKAMVYSASEGNLSTTGEGNEAFRHSAYNLTFDCGTGNTGAIGYDYLASNQGSIKNCKFIVRTGFCGISMTRRWSGPCLIKDVEITGGQYAIRIHQGDFHTTLENITISDQTTTGIQVTNHCASIRKLQSSNSVTALDLTTVNSNVALLESSFELPDGTASSVNPAIRCVGRLFGQGLRFKEYTTAINDTGASPAKVTTVADISVVDGTFKVLNRYTTHRASGLIGFDEDNIDNRLITPLETPTFDSSTPSDWANVITYGAQVNNASFNCAPAIQAAIDSGKPIVYLPAGSYAIASPIILRGSVRKLIGFTSNIRWCSNITTPTTNTIWGSRPAPLIRFESITGDNCTIEYIRIDGGILHLSTKDLVLKHFHSTYYSSRVFASGGASGTGRLFIEDCIIGPFESSNQTMFARQWNNEANENPQAVVSSGNYWILGLKTEKPRTMLRASGGKLNLYGASPYPLQAVPENTPTIQLFNIQALINFRHPPVVINGVAATYKSSIQEQGSWTKTMLNQDTAPGGVIQMYVSPGGLQSATSSATFSADVGTPLQNVAINVTRGNINVTWVKHPASSALASANIVVTPSLRIRAGATASGSTVTHLYRNTVSPPGGAYSVELQVVPASAINSQIGICCNLHATDNSYYVAFYNAVNGRLELGRMQAGTYTVLAGTTVKVAAAGSSNWLRIDVDGTKKTVYWNGQARLSSTDNAVTGGTTGLRFVNAANTVVTNTTGPHGDNFSVRPIV